MRKIKFKKVIYKYLILTTFKIIFKMIQIQIYLIYQTLNLVQFKIINNKKFILYLNSINNEKHIQWHPHIFSFSCKDYYVSIQNLFCSRWSNPPSYMLINL